MKKLVKLEVYNLLISNLKRGAICKQLGIEKYELKQYIKDNDLQGCKLDFLDDCFKLYYNQGLNNKEIALAMGISHASVYLYYSKHGLKPIPSNINNFKFTPFEESVIIGTVMGDANLSTRGSQSSARMTVNHVEKNLDYILYKKELLQKYVTETIGYILPKMKNANPQYSLRIKSSPALKHIWENIYVPKRRITQYVLARFTDISLALYYQDDGYKKVSSKRPNFYTYNIAMCAYPIEDIKSFQELLLQKWGIHSSVHKGNNLYIKAKSRDKFKSIVEPYVVKSMKYKL